MTGVAESLKSLIFKITIGTDCKLVNLLDMEYANLTHDDQNSRFDKPEIWCIIHTSSYNTLTSRAKASSNGQLLLNL